MRVTVELLKRKRACQGQLVKFAELFPAGVDVTEALCIAHAGVFAWGWAAANLLPASLTKEYNAKHAPLDAEYHAKRSPLDAEYRAKCGALDAEYDAKRAPFAAEYDAKRAALFGRLAESSISKGTPHE